MIQTSSIGNEFPIEKKIELDFKILWIHFFQIAIFLSSDSKNRKMEKPDLENAWLSSDSGPSQSIFPLLMRIGNLLRFFRILDSVLTFSNFDSNKVVRLGFYSDSTQIRYL